jgi:hypothetical protein
MNKEVLSDFRRYFFATRGAKRGAAAVWRYSGIENGVEPRAVAVMLQSLTFDSPERVVHSIRRNGPGEDYIGEAKTYIQLWKDGLVQKQFFD